MRRFPLSLVNIRFLGQTTDKVGEQLPAVAATVASLILVFFAIIFTRWDGYDPAAKNAVRARFRWRAWMVFFAFLFAVFSGLFGLIGIGTAHKPEWPDVVAVIPLALSVLLMMAYAFVSLLEI
jgi:hypothetical protein